jgi:hypothetical protein
MSNSVIKKSSQAVAWLMTVAMAFAFAAPTAFAFESRGNTSSAKWVSQAPGAASGGATVVNAVGGDVLNFSLQIQNTSATDVFYSADALLDEVAPHVGAHELRIGATDDTVYDNIFDFSYGGPYVNNNRFATFESGDAVFPGQNLTFNWALKVKAGIADGTYRFRVGAVQEYDAWLGDVPGPGAGGPNNNLGGRSGGTIFWDIVIGDGIPAGGGDMNVASISQPAAATIPSHAVATPLVKVKLTANSNPVTVTGLTVTRSGLGGYGEMSRLFTEVDGIRHGNYRSLPSTNEATLTFIGTEAVTIPANGSEIFTVFGNWADVTAAGDHTFSVTGVNSNAASVGGLPVTGNMMTTSATEAPTATVDDYSIGSAANIGDTQTVVAKVKVTNTTASEDMSLSGFVFKAIAPTSGTKVDASDVSNFTLYKNGVAISDAVNMTSNSYVYITLDSPITIEKGGSKYESIELKANINDGPGRIIKMDLAEYITGFTSEVVTTGLSNGFRAYVTDTYAPVEVTIGASDLTVALASNNPAAQTLLDGQIITLIKGEFNASKGAVTVAGMRVTLTGTDMDFGTTDEYANLRVYVDGTLVSEATDSEISSSDGQTSINVDFTDTFGLDGKVPFEVTIEAKTVDTTNTIKASVPGASMTVTRDSDSASVTATGTATGNTMTLTNGALTAVISATPVSLSKVAGSTGVEFVGVSLAAGVASDATVTAMTFEMDNSAGTASTISDVQNLYLRNAVGTAIAGPVNLNSSLDAVFTGLNIGIGAGNTEKFVLTGDLASSLTSGVTNINFELSDADGLTNIIAEDADGDQITVSGGAYNVNTSATVDITIVSAGRLTLELASSTPKSHQVVAATVGDLNTVINLAATFEDIDVKKIVLSLDDANAGTIDTNRDEAINKVTIYADGVEVASTYAVTSGVATFNIPSNKYIRVPAGQTVVLTVKSDYNSTVDGVADSGEVIRWTIDNFASDIEAIGVGSNTAIYAYPKAYDGTGVYWIDDASHAVTTIDDGALFSATDTTLTVTAATNIAVGDILLLDDDTSGAATYTSGDDFVIVTAIDGLDLTVIRGVAGVTANTVTDGDNIYVTDALLGGEASLIYANLPTVSVDGISQPSGTLLVGTFEALKFKLSDQTNGEEDVRIEELLVNVAAEGILTAGQAGWYITNSYLYNDGNLVSTYATDVTASGTDIVFATLDSDGDSVLVNPSGVWTVSVQVALGAGGDIGVGDTLRLSIDDFGSADNTGAITGGDIDWEDQEAPTTVVEWIDTTLTLIQGGIFIKS